MAISARQQPLEEFARFIAAIQRGQRIDVPESADEKGILWFAEIVLVDIAEDEIAAPQVRLDGANGGRKARICRIKEAYLRQQQQARIHGITIEGGYKRTALLVQPELADGVRNLPRLVVPIGRACGQPKTTGYQCQSMASRPAHCRRKGMHPGTAPQFPGAGIRLVVTADGLFPQGFKTAKQCLVPAPRQSLVEKDMGRGEDGRAINIMLYLAIGEIADAYRSHAAVACQSREHTFIQFSPPVYAVDWLQRIAPRIGRYIDDVRKVTLHGTGSPEAIQGIDYKIGIAQPAITVIPVSFTAGRLGYRGRHGRYYGAGIVVCVQLERDRGAYYGFLPFVRNPEETHALVPVLDGLFQETAADLAHSFMQGFVCPEQERNRVFQEKRGLLQNRGQRCIGRQPEGDRRRHISDVVATPGDFGTPRSIITGRTKTQRYSGTTGKSPDPPNQHHRPEPAAVLTEARGGIGDLNGAAMTIIKLRHQNGSVLQIVLLGAFAIRKFYSKEPIVVGFPEQGAEHRVAIEARKAAPDNVGPCVDQRANSAIADQGKI